MKDWLTLLGVPRAIWFISIFLYLRWCYMRQFAMTVFSTTQRIVKTLQRGVALKIVLANCPVSITFMYIFLTLMSYKSNWPKFSYTVIQVWLLCKTCESVLHRTNTGFVLLTSPYKPGANLYKEFICFQHVTLKSGRVAKYEYIKENEPSLKKVFIKWHGRKTL